MNRSGVPPTMHSSKRDGWIVVLLWIGVFGMIYAGYDVWTSPTPLAFRLPFSITLAASAGFVLWILYGTGYRLTDEELIIWCGPFRSKISMEAILEVKPTRSPLSAPACSLDRLRIQYGERHLQTMISPADKGQFLRDLMSRCPSLAHDGDGLVKREKAAV